MAQFFAFAQRDRRSSWIAGLIIVVVGSGMIFLGFNVYRLATQLTVITASPDTAPQIAYLSNIAGSRNGRTLYLLNLSTGISQQITRGGKLVDTMKWLPDGQTLALEDDSQVRLLNMTPGALTDTGQALPSWSPDGHVVLYQSKNDKNEWSWKAYDPATRTSALITSDISLPTLTPDGKSVAFATHRYLYLINTDGTNKRQFLAEQGKNGFAVQWSPDGKQLLLETAEYDPQFGAVSTLMLSVGDSDGSNLIPLGKAYHAGVIAWSPDSSKIAWASDKDLNPCVANANGKGVVCANGKDTVGIEILRWSLDSTQIAYLIDESSGSGFPGYTKPRICTMSAATMDKPQCYTVTGSDYTQMDLTWRP